MAKGAASDVRDFSGLPQPLVSPPPAGDCRDNQLWAERFFASQAGFDYYERRRLEHPTGRVSRPVQPQEPPVVLQTENGLF